MDWNCQDSHKDYPVVVKIVGMIEQEYQDSHKDYPVFVKRVGMIEQEYQDSQKMNVWTYRCSR